jgi:predicted GIY-YIG superfamily endonuclease
MKTRPERDPKQTAVCTYSIPCECGRSYIGETGRTLAVRLREHRHSLKEGRLEKSKLVQRAYEARIFETENNSRNRKYKELTHMVCSTNPISQPSLDISPIWFPFISQEVSNPQEDLSDLTDSSWVSIRF